MKPLHFSKAEISLFSTKFRHDPLQYRYYILNRKGLNNLIIKTHYSSDTNAPPRTNKNIITTSSGPSTTKNGLTNSPEEDTSKTPTKISKFKNDKGQLLTERIREITNSIKIQNTQQAFNTASKILNEVTGYSEVEKLKEKVIQQEKEFVDTRQRLASAKSAYEEAVTKQSNTQREINDLLQRKHQWSNEDVVKFTELYQNEHLNKRETAAAKEEFRKCEEQVEKEYTDLTRSIMMRYHEEQVWSDKIRSTSTYGTIALMTLNVILFVCVQTIFEPHKRQKLADKFEELLIKKLDKDEENAIFRKLFQKFEQMDERISQLNYPFTFRKQNASIVEFETKQNDIKSKSLPENELIIDDNLLEDTDKSIETYGPKNDILLTRSELDKIKILYTLMGAGAGWLLSFIFFERFNR
ncbi:Mdm33 family-domain-containing protein [Glomus cerebriforme]|uniref:Sensitive to high expression protein 9, mitochondrial n=1 Tax=Glomus cerebriforme TaxID=658196 RepID=A0A397T7Q0_9GLOM|nr:Mdm33 family-domain-containing protein [Glomus cerebriforme]